MRKAHRDYPVRLFYRADSVVTEPLCDMVYLSDNNLDDAFANLDDVDTRSDCERLAVG